MTDPNELIVQLIGCLPMIDEGPDHKLWCSVRGDWLRAAVAALTPAPAQPEPPTYASQMCQPNGVMFDAFGEPRTRYVRVTLEGRHCVMHPSEGDTYLKDAKDCGDNSEYTVADVYLSEREFEELGEFDGF